jgi:hypothetical protein
MKKTMILSALAIILLISCKKKDDPQPISKTWEATMWGQVIDQGSYLPLDSVEFKVFEGLYDTLTLGVVGYTGKDGKVTLTLDKGKIYQVYAKSRTYKFSYNTTPHHYATKLQLKGTSGSLVYSDYATADTKNYNRISSLFGDATEQIGYGCTNYYIQDPTE